MTRFFSRTAIVRSVVVVAFALIAFLVYESWSAIVRMVAMAHWWLLALAVSSLTIANVGMAVVFSRVMQRLVVRSFSDGEMVGMFLLSQVGKYIPGRIWSVAMQAAMLRSSGAAAAVFIANIELAIVSVAMVTGIGVAFLAWGQYGGMLAISLLAITWLVGEKLLHLDVARRGIDILRRRLPMVGGRLMTRGSVNHVSPDEKLTPIGHGGLLVYLLAYCLGWWLLARGATQLDGMACVGVVAVLSLSYVVGVISMLPAGIGAREGALVLLGPVLGSPHIDMAALAVTSRAAMVLMDVLAAGIGSVLLRIPLSEGSRNV